ncbi:hypothetical protein ACLKA6_019150 [Drosophila palustris]
MEETGEQEEEQRQLLLHTLNRLWSHYLQTSDSETEAEAKTEDDNQAASVKEHWLWLLLYNFQFLDDQTLQNAQFHSNFNQLPEELCSYLLAQVYQIISAAKRSQDSESEQQDKCIKQLRKQHNLAQLILSTPSDCNKILALRTFLTNGLGQHLLGFLLRVQIKHIASQKSLCQLCINLFPNCKWSAENPALKSLTSITQFIGSFHLNSQRSKARKQQQQIQQQFQQQQQQQHVQFSNEIQQSFDQFRAATKTSDELALLLIQLLTRCIDAEQEPQLSVTVHNFALGHLCQNCVDDANDEIIKFELLQLIAHCVNSFYVNVLDFNSNFSQLLYALAANRRSSLLSHGILYLMFGTLHNLVEHGAQQLEQLDVKHFDSCFDVLQEAAATTTTTCTSSLLFLHIYKLLLRLTDHLSRQEQQQQCLMESSNSSALAKQPPHRHKRQRHSQLHCTERSLSCYFQGKLYQLLPCLPPELQEHSVRSLMRTGSCCCHYNAINYATCLRLATQLSGSYQKCAYKFLHYNVLHTIFVKRSPQHCGVCEEKLKSPAFHSQLLGIYKDNYRALLNDSYSSMLLFLKHLKHIAYLLSYDLSAGILAEVVLPIFRQYKSDIKGNLVNKLPRLQILGKLDSYRVLHECLSIFVMYLSDIRLVKAFYNEENIGHMQDLLTIPELQRGVCDLIKVGIDNIAFLGDNSQEQFALSRRLIQLQLNSSDRASKLFQALLQKCAKRSQVKFWLDEASNTALLEGHKPVDILYITALQWTLNYELLKTSQLFYNEFAKIYSIPVEMTVDGDENENVEEKMEKEEELQLRHGDKTIIDILKLNYNALSCFLMLPKAAISTTATTTTTHNNKNNNNDALSNTAQQGHKFIGR